MDITSLEHEQQQLRNDLTSLIDNLNQDNNQENKLNHSRNSFDFIITHCEVNDRQGVGILVKRIFSDSSQVISLRSRNLYEGQQSFGESDYCLAYHNSSRAEILETVSQTFSHKKPKRILCIPYYPDDMLTAIALKDIFHVPLCMYIMDDQNIYVNNISDELTRELLEKSDLCLGISRNLCQAYEQKYQKRFWFLPPVA
uniref:hypothetical protein n=1 Tax=Cyanothece sp. BG0011 TaxID=2082950 RepID=UPI0018E51664